MVLFFPIFLHRFVFMFFMGFYFSVFPFFSDGSVSARIPSMIDCMEWEWPKSRIAFLFFLFPLGLLSSFTSLSPASVHLTSVHSHRPLPRMNGHHARPGNILSHGRPLRPHIQGLRVASVLPQKKSIRDCDCRRNLDARCESKSTRNGGEPQI